MSVSMTDLLVFGAITVAILALVLVMWLVDRRR
jgi:hypothetical protein